MSVRDGVDAGESTGTAAVEDRWVTLKRDGEGVSMEVIEQHTDGSVEMVDETWLTWEEFTGDPAVDVDESIHGEIRLDASREVDK